MIPTLQQGQFGRNIILTEYTSGEMDPNLISPMCFSFSNGNRTTVCDITVGGSGAYRTVTSVTKHAKSAGGKFYFEVLYNSGTQFGTNIPPIVCVGTATFNTSQSGPGYVLKGAAGLSGTSLPNIAAGDLIGVAIDFTTEKTWFAKNNTWVLSGDPVAGTNETFSTLVDSDHRVLISDNATYSLSTTVNLLSSQFVYSAPSGFAQWG